jgi:hypothetical protein
MYEPLRDRQPPARHALRRLAGLALRARSRLHSLSVIAVLAAKRAATQSLRVSTGGRGSQQSL